MTTRLKRRLEATKADGRGILMGFLPAGYPTPDGFTASARAAFAAGLDALEVGMPGPASALDGPLIKAAAREASHMVALVDEVAPALIRPDYVHA